MAVKEKAVVRLTPEQRSDLEQMARSGTHAARALAHARILLMTDQGEAGDGEPDEAVGVHANTVARIRKLFARGGLEAALRRKPPTGRQYRKLDGAQEARLVVVACSPAPEGQARWTLKLLAEKLVESEVVDSIDPSTVHRTLQRFTHGLHARIIPFEVSHFQRRSPCVPIRWIFVSESRPPWTNRKVPCARLPDFSA